MGEDRPSPRFVFAKRLIALPAAFTKGVMEGKGCRKEGPCRHEKCFCAAGEICEPA